MDTTNANKSADASELLDAILASGNAPMCAGCGTQFEPARQPPAICPICADDRQYVNPVGQRWTTHVELAARHGNRMETDGDLRAIGVTGEFAIGQRALLAGEATGTTVMWDCVSVVTNEAIEALERSGGIDLIAISHPHFYSSMVEWSDALGGIPIMLHAADRDWVQRSSPNIVWWEGDRLELSEHLTLLHLPGHFPGSSALHWAAAPHGRQALLAGDSLHPGADRSSVSVIHSAPNHIPVGPSVIRDLRRRLDDVEFDDLYGFTWGRNVIGDASAMTRRSLDRYLSIITN